MPWTGTRPLPRSDCGTRTTQTAYHDHHLTRILGDSWCRKARCLRLGLDHLPRSDCVTRASQATYHDHRLTGIPSARRPDAVDWD
ncbi:hypothetical protein QYF36_004737 [Acer negundo]|nr:hypothetical protein QYF36_004737 [Acer negundo]